MISHFDIKVAVRDRLLTSPLRFSLASSGLSISGVSGQSGILSRTSGSFLTETWKEGDEIQLSGFASGGNNGPMVITELTPNQLRIRCLPNRTLVNEAAGPSVVVSLGLPRAFQLENRKFSPVPGFPWMREAYLGGDSVGTSIGPNRRVRAETLYQLSLFAPLDVGSASLDSLCDFIIERLHPGLSLIRNGQTSTILTCGRAPAIAEDEWMQIPISLTLRTFSITPA